MELMDSLVEGFARIARQLNGAEAARQGFIAHRFLPGPKILAVVPLLFGARLCLGGVYDDDVDMWGSYEEAWDYPDIVSAVQAMEAFSDDVEPQGWERHIPSGFNPGGGRRRPGADPAREYVNP